MWHWEQTDPTTVKTANEKQLTGIPKMHTNSVPACIRTRRKHTYQRLSRRRRLQLELLEERLPLASDFGLLQDINQTVSLVSSNPENMTVVGTTFYFSAASATGVELWKSDGTAAGTVPVEDINASGDSNPRSLINVGGVLFFVADDGSGEELWRSDGTVAGTSRVKDIRPGDEGSSPEYLTNVGGVLYFSANDGATGVELWRSDGTSGGTIPVSNIRSGSSSSNPKELTNVSGTLYFTANDGITGIELWKSNGTAATTVIVEDIHTTGHSAPAELTDVGGVLYFTADDGSRGRELWKSTGGTAATTDIVKDIIVGAGSSDPSSLYNHGGTLYFSADGGVIPNSPPTPDEHIGRELWRSNGTAATTLMVADLQPDTIIANSSDPREFISVGAVLYFTADASSGRELWRTGGTAATTSQIKNIHPGINQFSQAIGSDPSNLLNVSGTLYFTATSLSGKEFWKSDGTSAGTIQVRSIEAGGPNIPDSLINIGSTIYMAGYDSALGYELWKSNGTEAGTVVVKDIYGDVPSSSPNSFVPFNGAVYFIAVEEGNLSNKLWKTNGSTVTKVHDIAIQSKLTVGGNYIYFSAKGPDGIELWKSDGSTSGTELVKNIFPDTQNNLLDSEPKELTYVNGTLFFTAKTSDGRELWKSDGTPAGTMLVLDIQAGDGSSNPQNLIDVAGTLYFSADDIATGRELWKSDGTPLGTVRVADINLAGGSSNPAFMSAIGNTLYFAAENFLGQELWKSNGTAATTTQVKDIAAGLLPSLPRNLTNVNGTLYFSAREASGTGVELWKSDGTLAGTVIVNDLNPGAASSNPTSLANINGTLYFSADNGSFGQELWKTDLASPFGMTFVKSIATGSASSNPGRFTELDGSIYFVADPTTGARELWKTDGTNAGTVAVTNFSGTRTPPIVGQLPKDPIDLFAFNGLLLFPATTPSVGTELYVLYGSLDMGDAPFLASGAVNGARHLANGPRLGFLRDVNEVDGVASSSASSDDANGIDDEDGIIPLSHFIRGKNTAITIDVQNTGVPAKVDAWIDWNNDGDWADPGEQLLASTTLNPGVATINVSVPASAALGNVAARFRISTIGGLSPVGFSIDGEVEDHLFTVLQDVSIALPSTGTNNLVVRRNGTNVEVFNTTTSTVLASSLLAQTNSLTLIGSPTQVDNLEIKFDGAGGYFSFPGGITIAGGAGINDSVIVTGTGNTEGVYTTAVSPAGQTQLNVTDSGLSQTIRYGEFENLTFRGLLTFSANSTLSIGSNNLTINAATPINLGNLTLIAGGSLTSDGVVSLGPAETIIGFGAIQSSFIGEASSLLRLSGGDMIVGNSSSNIGFSSRGIVEVGSNKLTLRDANQAALGVQTTIGKDGVPGRIDASNGLLVDFGNNITGVGVILTLNNVNQLLMNNGSIVGASALQQIELTGFVKGVGTLSNVTISGTNSPGFSPAVVQYGSMVYGGSGTVVMEIGGTTPGSSGHDQINHTGIATLGGTLDVQTINSFNPSVGQSFVLMTATGGFAGSFSTVKMPGAPVGSKWDLIYRANQLVLQLADIIDVTRFTINGSNSNLNRSGIASLTYDFDQAVTIASPTSLKLRNHTTGNLVDITGATVTGNGTSSLIWNLSTITIPDGQYTAELPASQVTNAAGRPMALSNAVQFHKRRGDMNADGAVNFADYGVVGANFDPLPGGSYRPGDADGNGAVNFADYSVIGSSFAPVPLAGIQFDFGDAAESTTLFATTLNRNGARNAISALRLGGSIDAEIDGQPTANADGDGADEDGVTWGTLLLGTADSVALTIASTSTSYVSAWVDFNNDGDWDDAGENVLQDVVGSNGLNNMTIAVPANAFLGNVTARVRLSETAGYGYAGLATWGEVEDYRVTIVQQSSSSSLASKIIHWNKELTDEVFKSHMDDVEAFFEGLTDDTASS